MALTLERLLNESIIIGDDIKIKVVMVSGRRVKLSIEAPPEVPVNREEVYIEQIRNSGQSYSGQKLSLAQKFGFRKKGF